MSNKAEKRGLAPKLRFPEFRGAGGWEERKAGALFANRIEDGEEGLPIYSVTMNDGMVKRSTLERRVEDIAESGGNKKVRKGDIAYNMMRMWQGSFGVSKEDCMVSPAYVVLSPESDAHPDFFGYLFKLPKYLQLLTSHSQGLTLDRLRLYYKDFARISVSIPSPSEQQKIADCLASLDELITLEAQKLDTLKTHKKGLMQLLFPAEGETLPQLRFPEFRDAGEWDEKRLGSSIEEFREKSTAQDEFEVLTSARSGLIRQREYYDNDRITERDNIGFNIIPPDYLTYRSRSDDRRFYFNENNLGITGIISTYYPVFRVLEGSNKFFVELLARYSEVVGKHSVGTSQTVLSLNELRRIKLPIPKKAEQQKIADCLASIDDLITAQTQKIAALKTHKKGLMQQLFPALDEVPA